MPGMVKVFLQYQVKHELDYLYEETMWNIAKVLSDFDAQQIEWYMKSKSSNTYMETFFVPTEAHFYALKKLWKTKGFLDQVVEGGVNGIQWIALKIV